MKCAFGISNVSGTSLGQVNYHSNQWDSLGQVGVPETNVAQSSIERKQIFCLTHSCHMYIMLTIGTSWDGVVVHL